jgi:hypothetical protein
VAGDELWWVLQHEGGTRSEEGLRVEDDDGRRWELAGKGGGFEVTVAASTPTWETMVQRPTWIGGEEERCAPDWSGGGAEGEKGAVAGLGPI